MTKLHTHCQGCGAKLTRDPGIGLIGLWTWTRCRHCHKNPHIRYGGLN